MKTAISIPDELFREVEDAAKKQNCSRSKIVAVATKEYLEKMKSMAMLETLNDVYAEPETLEEVEIRERAIESFGKHIREEPF